MNLSSGRVRQLGLGSRFQREESESDNPSYFSAQVFTDAKANKSQRKSRWAERSCQGTERWADIQSVSPGPENLKKKKIGVWAWQGRHAELNPSSFLLGALKVCTQLRLSKNSIPWGKGKLERHKASQRSPGLKWTWPLAALRGLPLSGLPGTS